MQLVLLALGIAIGATIAGADLDATTTNTPLNTLGPWAPWLGALVFGVGSYVHYSGPRGSLRWLLVVLLAAWTGERVGRRCFTAAGRLRRRVRHDPGRGLGRAPPVRLAQMIRRTVKLVEPHARELGAERELEGVEEILQRGNGADRQLRVFNANRDIVEVVREIAELTEVGAEVPSGADARSRRQDPGRSRLDDAAGECGSSRRSSHDRPSLVTLLSLRLVLDLNERDGAPA